ncbi:MAG: GH3 auxin-responsive promoter family protein [Gammaproteobacteria bacterium]|nr:GH3 auxin-responsive promoter family protein [Gammaproteobacteria bacterium]QOJ32168.1 MAG: GH3 auxin-responsive promoter family protein [Gammaproteobacteria bacterium]
MKSVRKKLFHAASALALRSFERRLPHADAINLRELRSILQRNQASEFGRRHDFAGILTSPDMVSAYRAAVPLSAYCDYLDPVARISRGEANVLTADPVTTIVGSAGTTGTPKRIPRSARAVGKTVFMVALVEQGVLDRGVEGARGPGRGISLMGTYQAPAEPGLQVPLVSGPNAGMARIRRQIPVLWTSPEAVFAVQDPAAMLYLHALFGLADRDAMYISTPFAPQLTAWFRLLDQHRDELVDNLRSGTIPSWLKLTAEERGAVLRVCGSRPQRAAEVERVLADGMEGMARRLWPGMKYFRTVTSGSFALSVPRLRQLAGDDILFYSGCHSSTEGILGINLKLDGRNDYALAVGNAFFEFLPLEGLDAAVPRTVDLADVQLGHEYELVQTSCAGLYRYRMGDIVRVVDRVGQAPVFNFLYRRGTMINLVGEKVTEHQTARAVEEALGAWRPAGSGVRDYSVMGTITPLGQGEYTFYIELEGALPQVDDIRELSVHLDRNLKEVNPYYDLMGRSVERLVEPKVKIVRSGTFSELLQLQAKKEGSVPGAPVKVPRAVLGDEQRDLLESCVVVEVGDG